MIYTASAIFVQDDNIAHVSRSCIIHAMETFAQDAMINNMYEIQVSASISDLVTATKGERVYTVEIRVGER